jgi:hypothetical protein
MIWIRESNSVSKTAEECFMMFSILTVVLNRFSFNPTHTRGQPKLPVTPIFRALWCIRQYASPPTYFAVNLTRTGNPFLVLAVVVSSWYDFPLHPPMVGPFS